MKIAVVEDQIELQEAIVYFLRRSGYDASGLFNGVELDHLMAKETIDLLLLDIGLPGEDGFSIASRLQEIPGLAIVMLTARAEEEDRIRSFECGADSYLKKPINFRELLAVLERARQRMSLQTDPKAPVWRLLREACLLRSPDGQDVSLSVPESCYLELMMRRAGQPASRRELIEAQGHDFMTYDERRLEVRISRLRKKIRDVTLTEDPLKSVWGAGYAFAAPCRLN